MCSRKVRFARDAGGRYGYAGDNTAGINLDRLKIPSWASVLQSYREELLELIAQHRYIEAEILLVRCPASDRQKCIFVGKYMPWMASRFPVVAG